MEQFCKDVLDFLESEYNDSYDFELKRRVTMPARLGGDNEHLELVIKMSRSYQLVLVDYSMKYLFGCYRAGEFIKERNQYRWQKELIDMIEGG